jgi:glycosyltransferase involved in cell wall biosynthesis
MLILHVVAPGEIGGLERVLQMLAQGQARAGDEVHVAVVLDRANHPLPETLTSAGVTPHPIVLPSRAYRRERAVIRHLCLVLRPDVVHTHGYRPDVVDSGPARQLGIPTVTTVHGFTGGGWRNRLYERLQRRAYRRFDAVVAVSRPLAQELAREGVPVDRIHVLQNAWHEAGPLLHRAEARHALGLPTDDVVVGWVGRLSDEKGADVLLDALVHLTDLPLTVSLVGEGPQRRALTARAHELGIENRVRFHGVVPDAGRHFSAFDVFVLSSRTEGTPIVLFEAMAAGVPIIAARVGGVPDVVSPAEAALVRPNDPRGFALELRELLRDPVVCRRRAQRARLRLVKDFSVPPWLTRYARVYSRICTAGTTAAAGVTP